MRSKLLPRFLLAVSLFPSVKELDDMERFKPSKQRLESTEESPLTGISNLASDVTASSVLGNNGFYYNRASVGIRRDLMLRGASSEPISTVEWQTRLMTSP